MVSPSFGWGTAGGGEVGYLGKCVSKPRLRRLCRPYVLPARGWWSSRRGGRKTPVIARSRWPFGSGSQALSLLCPEGVAAVRALQFNLTTGPPAFFPTPPCLAVGSNRHRLPATLAWLGSHVLPSVPQPPQHHADAGSLSEFATEANTSSGGRSIMIPARTLYSPKSIIAPASPNHLRDYAQKQPPR